MTNLRKSFILLSAAITMGNLREAQAAAKKAGPPRAASGGAEQAKQPARTAKKPRPGRRIADAA